MKKSSDKVYLSQKEYFEILDRIIYFINNCDTKSSIILGIFGVLFTIFFSAGGILRLNNIISKITLKINIYDIIYMFFLFVALAMCVIGLIYLVGVLVAKVDNKKYQEESLDTNSLIYFGNISDYKFLEYKDKISGIDQNTFINDIISQIYINSVICDKKYKNYNRGIYLSVVGFILFIIFFLLGIIFM